MKFYEYIFMAFPRQCHCCVDYRHLQCNWYSMVGSAMVYKDICLLIGQAGYLLPWIVNLLHEHCDNIHTYVLTTLSQLCFQA